MSEMKTRGQRSVTGAVAARIGLAKAIRSSVGRTAMARALIEAKREASKPVPVHGK